MKLDLDCVRSILLTVEKYEVFNSPVTFDNVDYLTYDDYLSSYATEMILYHVQYCIRSKLLIDYSFSPQAPQTRFLCGLDFSGHEFLSNARLEERWIHTKKILSKLGTASLKVVSATAEGLATAALNKYLKEEIF